MAKKLLLSLSLILGVALACSNTTPQPQQQNVQDVPQTEQSTPNTLYLPEISTGLGPFDSSKATGTPLSINPGVSLEVSSTTIKTGETISVVGRPADIGLPNYTLIFRDEGVQEDLPLAKVTYDNQVTAQTGNSRVLELVSAEGQMDHVIFVLRGIAAGTATLKITATGEVHAGYPGPATWSGAESEGIAITVTE